MVLINFLLPWNMKARTQSNLQSNSVNHGFTKIKGGFTFNILAIVFKSDSYEIIDENKIKKEDVDLYMQKTLSEIKGAANIEEESITDEDFVDEEMGGVVVRQNKENDYSMSDDNGFYDDEFEDDNFMQTD